MSPFGLEIFYGATDPAATHVYVRWWVDPPGGATGLKVAGVVRGPFSQLARTLPATVSLADQGPGASLLARAVLPDPCYWMPGAPYLYTVEVEVRDGERVVAQAQRMLGVRTLGVTRRRFRLGGKGWFPRAIHQEIVRGDEADDLSTWREHGAVMIVRGPSDELCRQASEQGVLLFTELPLAGGAAVGRVSNPSETLPNDAADAHVRRLAQWPAVGLAIIPTQIAGLGTVRAAGRNLLIAQELDQGANCTETDCLIARADAEGHLAAAAASTTAVIGARRRGPRMSLAAARAACDALQAELAGRVEVAGVALLPAPAGPV